MELYAHRVEQIKTCTYGLPNSDTIVRGIKIISQDSEFEITLFSQQEIKIQEISVQEFKQI